MPPEQTGPRARPRHRGGELGIVPARRAADELAGRDLGRLLYELLTRGEREEAPAETRAPTVRRGREPRQLGIGW
jgi:hypothetical protein